MCRLFDVCCPQAFALDAMAQLKGELLCCHGFRKRLLGAFIIILFMLFKKYISLTPEF
jgi:hypothetical protein